LFSFKYSAGSITSAFVRHYESGKLGARILSNNVLSVDVDATGDAWAATDLGLNRVREVDGVGQTSAYTDLQHFLDAGLGEGFSSQILRSLAGGEPVSLEVSGATPVLFAVTVHGLTRVDLVPGVGPSPDDDDPRFSIYPNPVRQGRELKVDGFTGVGVVEIYDLQGRKLRTTRNVEPGDIVWQLETLTGDPVSNGLYLVRFVLEGRSSVRVLAVER
jgi:hypothetical protein